MKILLGDCLDILPTLDANSVDSVVTDPPYGLSFMGKAWDHGVPAPMIWKEVLRVLKPGGHLLAFGGSRTYHRIAVAIEDSGFEIRDTIMWIYGTGFPKSLDVSKAIDKAAGANREVLGRRMRLGDKKSYFEDRSGTDVYGKYSGESFTTTPAKDAARQWEGWGTALKPAHEPITVARKPIAGTVVANVLKHGTGAMNIDGCRVGLEGMQEHWKNYQPSSKIGFVGGEGERSGPAYNDKGRFPANVIHDGSEEVAAMFPDTTSGAMKRVVEAYEGESVTGFLRGRSGPHNQHGGSGSAARFFYGAKASKADRGEGNDHPTVKPTALMRYLCRLVTPPGGVVLDPFAGSGSTGKAAILEGFGFVGIEKEETYAAIAERRIKEVMS